MKPSDVCSHGLVWIPFIDLSIEGEPTPWARHVGKGAGAITPPEQKRFKKTISEYAWAKMARFSAKEKANATREFRAAVRVYVKPETKALQALYDDDKEFREGVDRERIFTVNRPDLDNWIKLPLDAMNKIVWADDAQVVSFDGSGKFYSLRPRLDVTVYTRTAILA